MKITELIATRKNKQLAEHDSYFDLPELRALPRELREFFVKHGASQLKPNTLVVRGFETEIEWILGISEEDFCDLGKQTRLYDKRLPKGQFPFATLACGDLLTVEPSTLSLHLWIHDKFDEYQLRRLRAKLPVVSQHYEEIAGLSELKAPPPRDPSAKFWVDPAFLAKLKAGKKP
jgi:hypothetical protein